MTADRSFSSYTVAAGDKEVTLARNRTRTRSLGIMTRARAPTSAAPWQYALLARRLLLDGSASRVAIMKYTLFPDGDVESMLEDLGAALEWCRIEQDITAKSGHRVPVVLAAHSAGAHLCALHFARSSAGSVLDNSAERALLDAPGAAPWLPDRFVALSGVFDIAAHFAHERTRLVHWLSPMWLAMIGRKALAVQNGRAGGRPHAHLLVTQALAAICQNSDTETSGEWARHAPCITLASPPQRTMVRRYSTFTFAHLLPGTERESTRLDHVARTASWPSGDQVSRIFYGMRMPPTDGLSATAYSTCLVPPHVGWLDGP